MRGAAFFANFTVDDDDGTRICASGARCESSEDGHLPNGTELFYVGSRNGGKARQVCLECYLYYKNAPDTITAREAVQSQSRAIVPTDKKHRDNVRRDVNRSYARRSSVPVKAVGADVNIKASSSSYQPQHLQYDVKKKAVAKRVHEAVDPDKISVKVEFVYLKAHGGKTKQVVVSGDLSRGIGWVDIAIGAVDLKNHILHELARPWKRWSRGFDLPVDEVEIFSGDGSIPLRAPQDGPDLRVLRGVYSIVKGKPKGPVKLLVVISQDLFEQVAEHKENADPDDDSEHETVPKTTQNETPPATDPEDAFELFSEDEVVSEPVAKRKSGPASKRPLKVARRNEHVTSGDEMPPPAPPVRAQKQRAEVVRSPSDPPASPPRKRSAPDRSPTVNRIRRALQAVEEPSDRSVKQLLNATPIHGRLYYERVFQDLDSLTSAPPLSLSTLGNPVRAILYLTKEMLGDPGSFKTSYKAQLSSPNPLGFGEGAPFTAGETVCAKQGSVKNARGKPVPMPDADALALFIKEMLAMEWTKRLTGEAYASIKRRLGGLSEDDVPEIPRLSFVRCALFIADPPSTGGRRLEGGVYLLEELLDVNRFYKWLGNASVLPLEEDENEFTAFLNFMQHLQWVETGGRMFVSDFQGVGNKLTDPQVMTHAEFTDKFTDANVISGFILATVRSKPKGNGDDDEPEPAREEAKDDVGGLATQGGAESAPAA
ncbi:hypothetical protein AURDEDRAFT_161768 [Auricularia subglabra TFB-10046 SS5]|nr:hypothetical protein AURDEDRAFT_161768 [Auricularia subglabra TFB-10046 SS5]